MITLSSRKTLSFTPSLHEIESIFQKKISANVQTSRVSGSIFVSSGSDSITAMSIQFRYIFYIRF